MRSPTRVVGLTSDLVPYSVRQSKVSGDEPEASGEAQVQALIADELSGCDLAVNLRCAPVVPICWRKTECRQWRARPYSVTGHIDVDCRWVTCAKMELRSTGDIAQRQSAGARGTMDMKAGMACCVEVPRASSTEGGIALRARVSLHSV